MAAARRRSCRTSARIDSTLSSRARSSADTAAGSRRAWSASTGALGAAHFVLRLTDDARRPLDLDTINLAFFLVGLALHGSLRSYGRAVSEAIEGTAGILVQFPLYFGMVGLMKASGFVAAVSGGLVGAAGGSPQARAVRRRRGMRRMGVLRSSCSRAWFS